MEFTAFPCELVEQMVSDEMSFALIGFAPDRFQLFNSVEYAPGAGKITICNFGVGDKPKVTLYSTASPVTYSAPTQVEASTKVQEREEYLEAVSSLIDGLKREDGKVVYARRKLAISNTKPADVAQRYFNSHPEALCFIYYTPQTGLWIGATPELILRERSAGCFESMALAGTYAADDATPWDDKNIREHDFVLSHIVDTMQQAGLTDINVTKSECRTGNLRHLMHTVTAIGDASFESLTHQLSPTPAICGTPREVALQKIQATEPQPRLCYGGEIVIETDKIRASYLNLRCSLASYDKATCRWIYNIFCGGGLTALSQPTTEWLETEMKASSLMSAIESKEPI